MALAVLPAQQEFKALVALMGLQAMLELMALQGHRVPQEEHLVLLVLLGQ
jgi:hypothetical protein